LEDTTSGVGETPSPSTSAPAGNEAPATSDVSPGSSPESSGNEPSTAESRKSLLDVVREAAPRREQPGQPMQGDLRGAPPAPGAQQPGEELGPLTQAEYDAYVPRTQKRIRQYQAEIRKLNEHIGPLESAAKTTTELQNFLRQSDIAKEDFGLVLDLAAAMRRGDFRTFLEGVGPYVKLAQESLGIQLPPDLAQAVQMGHMTQDAARYTAQVRGSQALAASQLQRVQTEASQREYVTQVRSFQNEVAGAVSQWEQQVKRTDPDYARKEPVVRELLHAVVHERGPPRSPAEAVEIARQAYERANQMASRFVPAPRSTHQNPSSINRVNGARAEPRSLKEAVHLALERSR
jgi:hypothetical protein